MAEVNDELVDRASNKDLKSLRIKNLNKIIVSHLNINFIRKKFDFLAHQVQGNIDKSFPPGQFLLDGYSASFRSDRDGNGGGILLFIREDISSKLIPMNDDTLGFFVEINLRNQKKLLLSCSYNPKSANIKSF